MIRNIFEYEKDRNVVRHFKTNVTIFLEHDFETKLHPAHNEKCQGCSSL